MDHRHSVNIVQQMLDSAASADLRWPIAVGDVKGFAEGVLGWARAARCMRSGSHGFDGGKSPHHSYKAKNFMRVVLCILETSLEGAFENLRYGDLQEWLPDVGSHCEPLQDMQVADAQQKISVSGLPISCWACLCG